MSAATGPPVANGASGDFPSVYYAIIRTIDRFSDVTGKLIALSMLFLVGSITYEVVARYFFRAPTVWVFESSYMVNGAAFMLGCAYALHKGAHVRTDIFWENSILISLKKKRVAFAPFQGTLYRERPQSSSASRRRSRAKLASDGRISNWQRSVSGCAEHFATGQRMIRTPEVGSGSNPDFLLAARTSASAECRHWSGRAVRWSSCAIPLRLSALAAPGGARRCGRGRAARRRSGARPRPCVAVPARLNADYRLPSARAPWRLYPQLAS